MFAIPALRRPAASLLPRGMADASESALTHSGGAAADTKPADNVTPKQSWANTVEASESHPAYDQHGLRGRFREQEQEVIVRHYDGRQPEVIRADSGVKRYSDWR